jgi:Mg2+-importing ATPase
MRLTLILVIIIFAINMYFSRPFLDSFLFALALAVGLTPELLPVIISVSLALGAKRMAKKKVIVKKLSTIENLGSMNVLCSDKTGTLTEGVMKVNNFFNFKGNSYEKVFDFAYLNAYFQNGYSNPIDDAIRNFKNININGIEKLDEIPYDFIRKRLTILISKNQGIHNIMISKGAIPNILNICSLVEISEEKYVALSNNLDIIEQFFQELSNKGFKILGVAYKNLDSVSKITKDDEYDMIFLGFLVLFDPLKKDIPKTINELNRLGISFKIITGDNKFVANYVGQQIGFTNPITITGSDIHTMSDEALIKSVNNVNIFAEIEPNQKERIILTLKKVGNVVGYMGDGINDAPALHTADVSISVDSGVDVAKDAAEIILLEKDLEVLIEGVKEGRRTFANTNKYIYMTTSANFGNMFSMAGASLFLPFLPMLPTQILLTNLITDFPAMAIGADNVDIEFVEKPRRWNIKFIRNFMIIFGIESSIFDFITFFVLFFVLNATIEQFRTGWFLISVFTEILILLVIRTQKVFYKSKPGQALLIGTIITLTIVFIIILTPIGWIFGFTTLPITFHLILWTIILLYILMTKLTKKLFYKYFFY